MLALPHSLGLQLDFLPITNNTMKVSPFLGLLPTAALAQQLSSVAFFAKDQATALKESVERAMEYSLRTNAANRTTPVVSKKLVKSRVDLRSMGRKRV